ncbi:hypothetical protein TSOC_004096, partial [Tetrabaena socialis]
MSAPGAALSLYRELLRHARTLPRVSQRYYVHFARQHFNGHRDETDPERVLAMIQRARTDCQWVLSK